LPFSSQIPIKIDFCFCALYQHGNPGETMSDTYPELPPAALRALAEAEARRRSARAAEVPPELGGRDGPEPVRYGDWERKGIAVDF
jgi:hypothetical protein